MSNATTTEAEAKPPETGDADEGVDFLYRAMYERDPKKRRVKPVERHLIQLDFGLSDSEEDSDFEIKDHEGHDDSGGSGDEVDDGSSGGFASEDDDDEDEDEESVVSESELQGEMSVVDIIAKAKEKRIDSKNRPSDKIKMLICAVCLGEHSEDSDEIVECDQCSIAVHEGCYGDFNSSGCYGETLVSDTDSNSSVQTASSTEPWFCDSCKAGVTSPCCELCPNLGGIFKETDAGRWVHIVCALYIPGVAFGDVTKLRWITLSEMQQAKWGMRVCSYCEDDRFGKTGVCVGCDAGMCRNYFHVTCGQREGLLSEASLDEEIADPFYAYCKLHADKAIVRRKRQNWLAVQSRIKQENNKEDDPLALDRIKRKLKQCQKKYNEQRKKKPAAWVPTGTDKVARMLTTSASACRRLMRKAELLGISTEAMHHSPSKASGEVTRRKHHVAPAFSADFINYYLDRDARVNNLKHKLDELMTQNERLTEEEKTCREKYDKLTSEVEGFRMTNAKQRCHGENLWKILGEITGKKIPLPSALKPPQVKKTPAKTGGKGNVFNLCGICEDSNDQHMLVQCDICQKHYHLGCLDPPLTRMPKKTAFSGWQCSECMSESSDSSEDGDETVEEKKEGSNQRKKRVIREPNKFIPHHEVRVKKGLKGKQKGKRRVVKRKRAADDTGPQPAKVPKPNAEAIANLEDEDSPEVLTVKRPRKTYTPKPKPKDVRTECGTCKQPGANKNLVRCDGCKRCYHFGCLDPPCKSTPKIRGYQWFCTDCDTNSEDDSDGISIEEMDVIEDPPNQTSTPKVSKSQDKPTKTAPKSKAKKPLPKLGTKTKSSPKLAGKNKNKANPKSSKVSPKLSSPKTKSGPSKSAEKTSVKSSEISSPKSGKSTPKSGKSSPKSGKSSPGEKSQGQAKQGKSKDAMNGDDGKDSKSNSKSASGNEDDILEAEEILLD